MGREFAGVVLDVGCRRGWFAWAHLIVGDGLFAVDVEGACMAATSCKNVGKLQALFDLFLEGGLLVEYQRNNQKGLL